MTEPNAYFFCNRRTRTYGCYTNLQIIDETGLPAIHMGYSKIRTLAGDLKKVGITKGREGPYGIVCGLPDSDSIFDGDGGRKNFRPATDRELEELLEHLG